MIRQSSGLELPECIRLEQNYPNPFNPTTQISFSLPEAGDVRLEVYNMLGQKVTTLVDEFMNAGRHTVTWTASSDAASGVYLYHITAGDFAETKKMVLMK
jgi:5-hydroxyisourate hydrolase-like protein (transthyretin family)